MIKCLIIDDEPLALQQLEGYIKKIPYLELAASCQSVSEALGIIKTDSIDAVFTDINMPDMNGLDFVRAIHDTGENPLIVFTTAYSEYAVESFTVDAVDYLLKPFGQEDVERVAAKLFKIYEQSNVAAVSSVDEDDTLFLKTEHKIVRIDIKDIRYIEGMSEYLKIHLEGHPKPLIVLLSMKKLEERLPTPIFMRIHRSYIINLKKIQEVNKNRVILDADTYLPIGDLYRQTFMNYLETKFIGK
ncbi:LytTR family DNA-binding domain-containing protein [Prevotella sp. Rep29]|uniref:LytR/AlgR family response regulator transcription factor n=1 Tax=Prevotella sp. Rep29 TaxID=2691580 RepID=UPI001C6E5AB6|nr:LytTR family DNA-binding domain-containing protein [Prevotella sp. Rep29]QYR11451.1 response regulator [Prevotella sp. Rep29]